MNKPILFILLSVLVLVANIPLQNAYGASVEYLVIGGGGGGGGNGDGTAGGGGGAGAYYTGTTSVSAGDYTITVGNGGGAGAQGGSSIFSTITAIGGYGASSPPNGGNSGNGGAGGTGGGGGAGAGGGGSTGAGGTIDGCDGKNGGTGTASSITGTSVTRAGGGGGGAKSCSNGSGGSGGGGAGGTGGGGSGANGQANTGSGGGGKSASAGGTAGSGGSGIVIIRYLTGTVNASGGTESTSGGYTIHTFTTSGTFTVEDPTPSAPLNPLLSSMGTHTATASWEAPTDGQNISGYRVYINDAIFNNDTGTTDLSLPITGLTSGSLQTLKVHAWNATGAGANSSSATNWTVNTAPTLDKVNAYNTTAFQLFYTINGTFNGIQVDNQTTTIISNSTSNAVSLIVNNIRVAVDQLISIFAHNMGGISAESNSITNATTTPEVPVLTSTAQTTSTITLAMASNSTGSSYNIKQSPSGCETLTWLINGTTSPYIVTGLSTSTQYCFQTFSVNAYGNSTGSNLLNVTTSSTPAPDAGGGGAGGGGTNPVGAIDSLLSLNIIDEIHRAVLGQLLSDNIKVVWDSEKNLDVKAIIVADSPFNIVFQKTPFTLLGNPSGSSEAEINYSIQIPSKFCSDGQTVGCVQALRYEVSVEIQAVHDGLPITKNTIITIDLSGKTDIPFTFVLLAIGSVPVAYFARKLGKGNHKRTAQSSHGKSRKNGSSRKSLEL